KLVKMYAIILIELFPHLLHHALYGIKPGNGLLDQVGHGFQRQEFHKGVRGFLSGHPPYQKSDRQIFDGKPYDQEPEGEGGSFYKDSKKEAERKETHQLYKVGQEIFQIGKNDRYFRIIGIEKP